MQLDIKLIVSNTSILLFGWNFSIFEGASLNHTAIFTVIIVLILRQVLYWIICLSIFFCYRETHFVSNELYEIYSCVKLIPYVNSGSQSPFLFLIKESLRIYSLCGFHFKLWIRSATKLAENVRPLNEASSTARVQGVQMSQSDATWASVCRSTINNDSLLTSAIIDFQLD